MKPHAFSSFKDTLQLLGIDHGAWESAQCKCLTKYLLELKTKTCVVEPDYVDAGYLADYAGYYARCHDDIPRFTRRLHFFDMDPVVLREKWESAIGSPAEADETEKEINAHYLGFVVLRPLQSTIIGRTCLTTYPPQDEGKDDDRRRRFPILRTYRVTFYGVRLQVKSIAFQQQDKEIAACATAAIWFMMHALPTKFTAHEIPSPFEITNAGWDGLIQPMEGEVARKFPAVGLDIKQIVACLRKHGLECTVHGVQPDKPSDLLECVASYVQGGYPILVVSRLYTSSSDTWGYRSIGLHATTVLGFAYDSTFREGGWANRIQRLFAHDDGIGPFSSFRIESCSQGDFTRFLRESEFDTIVPDSPLPAHRPQTVEQRITGYLGNESGLPETGLAYCKMVPAYFVVPTHPKIHFPYETVSVFAEHVMAVSRTFGAEFCDPNTGPPKLSWSIRLTDTSEFKHRIRVASWVNRQAAEELLCAPLSRFLWSLHFTEQTTNGGALGEIPAIEFVFDATALQQDGGLSRIVVNELSSYAPILDRVLQKHAARYVEERERGSRKLKPSDPAIEPCLRRLAQKGLGRARSA